MPMDARDIEKLVAKAKDDIIKEVNDRLPRKVGVTAVNHFKQNFRDGGWLDNGLHPWKRTRRQDSNSPDAKYGPLPSRRNHMMRSIQGTGEYGQGTVLIDAAPCCSSGHGPVPLSRSVPLSVG